MVSLLTGADALWKLDDFFSPFHNVVSLQNKSVSASTVQYNWIVKLPPIQRKSPLVAVVITTGAKEEEGRRWRVMKSR